MEAKKNRSLYSILKRRRQGRHRGKARLVLVLLLSMLFSLYPRPVYASSYVNTNLNTFIHDTADTQTGHPGEDMQIHVRIGYNGVNGLYNPPTEEITNIRVRLSNDQSYLAENHGPATYHKNNPYSGDEEGDVADAWEEGYKQGKNNAYKADASSYYSLVGGVYPFEVNASLFTQEQRAESLSVGEYLDLTFNVTVRSDALTMKDNEGNTSNGYFGIPFTIWYTIPTNDTGFSGSFQKTEFINVFITPTGEISDAAKETKDQAFAVGENQSTPAGSYPGVMDYSVNFRNQSGRPLYDVRIQMHTTLAETDKVLLTESTKAGASQDFPFNINEGNYDRNYEKIEAGETIPVPYSMAIKKNAATGYYPLSYTVSYKRSPGAGTSLSENYSFFVNVRNSTMIDEDANKGEFNENDRTRARLIIESYRTEPEKIFAGEPFTLVLVMKNASSAIPASNILFSLTSAKANDAAVFNMEGGANSVVVNSLPAGDSTTLQYAMTAAAGVDPKTYSITLEEKYDSPEYKNAVEKIDIDIPVYQNARLSTSNFDVTPENIQVGEEANVMFSINNTGKVILYNVEAVFEAPEIRTTSTYVGNIEPGKTGSVDVVVNAEQPLPEGKLPVLIRYEDINGNRYEESTEVTLYITEAMYEEEPMDFSDMDNAGSPDAGTFSMGRWLPAAGVLGALGIAAASVYLRKKRKKETEQHEDI